MNPILLGMMAAANKSSGGGGGTITLVQPAVSSGSLSGSSWTPAVGYGYNCAHSSTAKSSGKWYFEVDCPSHQGMSGIVREGHDWTTYPQNGGVDGCSTWRTQVYYKGSLGQSVTDLGLPSDTAMREMWAVDLDAGKVWVGVDGIWYTGTPGVSDGVYTYLPDQGLLTTGVNYYIALSSVGGETETIIQPGDAAYSVPAGFAYWTD